MKGTRECQVEYGNIKLKMEFKTVSEEVPVREAAAVKMILNHHKNVERPPVWELLVGPPRWDVSELDADEEITDPWTTARSKLRGKMAEKDPQNAAGMNEILNNADDDLVPVGGCKWRPSHRRVSQL